MSDIASMEEVIALNLLNRSQSRLLCLLQGCTLAHNEEYATSIGYKFAIFELVPM